MTPAQQEAVRYLVKAAEYARRHVEQLPAGYTPGTRYGPEERELHASLVVGLQMIDASGLRHLLEVLERA